MFSDKTTIVLRYVVYCLTFNHVHTQSLHFRFHIFSVNIICQMHACVVQVNLSVH